jgi:hypothetical protein
MMQNFDQNIWFLRKAPIFFAENCRQSPKIAIITSTPGANPTTFELTATTPAL